MKIPATVGRVVWFYTYVAGQGHKGPLAAHVAKVSDQWLNLMVIGEDAVPRPELDVLLVQEDEPLPNTDYCTWMPYQIGQAKKNA